MADYAKALKFVLAREGGWHAGNLRSDSAWTLAGEKRDPHPTMKGITQTTYDNYRIKLKLPKQSVKVITDAEVSAIYKAGYWNGVVRDDHSDALALFLFDASVNFGPGVPQMWLRMTEDLKCLMLMREATYKWMARTTNRGKANINGWLNRMNALYTVTGLTREKPFSKA